MSATEMVEVPKVLLERVLDRLDSVETTVSEYREENERDKATIRQKVTEVEQREPSGSGDDLERDGEQDNEPRGTPMEQMIRSGEAGVLGRINPRDERAMAIAEYFEEWASKTPNGLVIRDGLKKLLTTATGEKLAWSQINRACDALQEATGGAIARKKTRKHGWILVAQPDDYRLRSLLAATR